MKVPISASLIGGISCRSSKPRCKAGCLLYRISNYSGAATFEDVFPISVVISRRSNFGPDDTAFEEEEQILQHLEFAATVKAEEMQDHIPSVTYHWPRLRRWHFLYLLPDPQYCLDFCKNYKYFGTEYGEGELIQLCAVVREWN